jgi:hypothetical protein
MNELLAEITKAVNRGVSPAQWRVYRARLEEILGTQSDPLEQVCSIAEYAERAGTYVEHVHRKIKRGELQARKSGGVWLVRLPAEDSL